MRVARTQRQMVTPAVTGTRDLAGSRQGGIGRSDFDLDMDQPSRRPLPPLNDPFFDDDETVFDVRGQKTSRKGAIRRALGEDFANEIAATTGRLKSRLHVTADSLQEEANQSSSAFRRKADEMFEEMKQPSLSKWTRLTDTDTEDLSRSSAAAERARKSKARLSDLEQEMEEMAEKQARREKRAAALRALVSETTALADESLAGASSMVSSQSVHRSEKSEKHVSF